MSRPSGPVRTALLRAPRTPRAARAASRAFALRAAALWGATRVASSLLALGFLGGCVLIPDPAARRPVEIAVRLPASLDEGAERVVASWLVPAKVELAGRFVQLSGRLERPARAGQQQAALPRQVVVRATVLSSETGRVRKRFRLALTRTPDDAFRGAKLFARSLAAGSLVTVSVEPLGAALPAGTGLTVCLDMARRKTEFRAFASCAAGDAPTTFPEIEARILAPRCGVSGCHDPATAEEGLVLIAGEAYANLVEAPARQAPLLRVRPRDPERSYLVRKLRGGTPVGGRMPLGGPFLTGAEIAGIVEWIENGADP